jgi:predicted enzyme related to lactoylglutathione lyase
MVLWAALSTGLAPLAIADLPPLPPLTTASGNPRLPGKFVWADLITDNLPAARAFYGRLFGWTFREAGSYVIALNDERPLGGMIQRPRPKNHPAAPRWFGYISVPNVERARRVVEKAGGRVLAAPRNLPKRGEQAVFTDPEGAIFGVIKSSSGDPEDFLPEPGDWIWIERLSRDAQKSGDFYRQIAGYDIIRDTRALENDYVYVSENYARAAAVTLTADKKTQPTWLLFVRVQDLISSLGLVQQLGGQVLINARPELFGGKLAVIADPTGAAVGLMEWSHAQLKGGRR